MKDSKTLLLLIVSLLLLLASITLLWSWGYQFSFNHKSAESIPVPATPVKTVGPSSDSLQKIYFATLAHLDSSIDSVYNHTDSIKGNLDLKLTEFYQLRNQITDLFKNRVGDADVKLANQRIMQLQQRLAQLRSSNSDVENENRRLNDLLLQYTKANQKTQPEEVNPPIVNSSNNNSIKENVVNENKPPIVSAKQDGIGSYIATDLQLTAITGDAGAEKETNKVENTGKLVGKFTIKNNNGPNSNIELMIVILQPDGRTLQKSTWESGSFETTNGKKIYSCKISTNCEAGETKRLNFWLASDKYQKGIYTMQVYQNGILIAHSTKQLS